MNAPAWFTGTGAQPGARLELICFGSAGSGGGAFLGWNRIAPAWLRIVGVQLPGREFRHREAPWTDLQDLAATIAAACAQRPGPYAFFGHSFGALLAYLTACELQDTGARAPLRLCVAGRPAPQLPLDYPDVDGLRDEEFLALLHRFDGTDPQVLADAAALAAYLPAIRADLRLNAGYLHRARAPLALPIAAMRGRDDPACTADELAAWSALSRAPTRVHEWDGEHFFFKPDPRPLLAALAALLAAPAPSRAGHPIESPEEEGTA